MVNNNANECINWNKLQRQYAIKMKHNVKHDWESTYSSVHTTIGVMMNIDLIQFCWTLFKIQTRFVSPIIAIMRLHSDI